MLFVLLIIIFRFTPFQCEGKSPAYYAWSRGYMDRLRLDSGLTFCSDVFNLGKFIKISPWHIGIMIGEYMNKIGNMLKCSGSAHHLTTAVGDMEFQRAILNYLNLRLHIRQKEKDPSKRINPEAPLHMDEYPTVFKEMRRLYNNVLSLEWFGWGFHHFSDTKYTLLPTVQIIQTLPEKIHQKILSENLLFNTKKEWDSRHTIALHSCVEKFDIKNIGDISANKVKLIVKEFTEAKCDQTICAFNMISEKLHKILKDSTVNFLIN